MLCLDWLILWVWFNLVSLHDFPTVPVALIWTIANTNYIDFMWGMGIAIKRISLFPDSSLPCYNKEIKKTKDSKNDSLTLMLRNALNSNTVLCNEYVYTIYCKSYCLLASIVRTENKLNFDAVSLLKLKMLCYNKWSFSFWWCDDAVVCPFNSSFIPTTLRKPAMQSVNVQGK